jgi:hypothetical protein
LFLITLGIIGTQGEFIRLLKKLQDIKILSPVNVANDIKKKENQDIGNIPFMSIDFTICSISAGVAQ